MSNRRLAGYLAGATLARVGDDMSGPALLLLALSISGSGSEASLVFGGLTVASGVGGPLFGVALDRAQRPGRTLAAALVAYAMGLGAVAAILGRVPLLVVVIGAAAVGVLAPALAGGWTSQLQAVLDPEHLARGHAMDAATYNVATLVGPALAATVTSVWGSQWAVAGAVAMLIVAAPLAWVLPARHRFEYPAVASTSTSVGQQLRAGFLAIVQVPGLRAVTVASCTAYVGSGLFVVACPVLGEGRLGGASHGALLFSVVAAAALLTTSAMARWTPPWQPEKTFFASTTLAGVALMLIAATAGPTLLLLGAVLLGLAEGPQLAAIFTIRQRDAPAALRGQVFTTAASLKLTAGALGSLAGGILLQHSIVYALLVAAATQLVAVLVFARATTTRFANSGDGTSPQ